MLFSIYDFRFSIFSLSRVHLRSSVVFDIFRGSSCS